MNWQHYWRCQQCSHPDRTGDLCSIVMISDFYTTRQWHSIGSCGIYRSLGFDHDLMLTVPVAPEQPPGPGRTMRLFLFRAPGRDFSERDRALLTLLRLLAAGHTNSRIARELGISEGTMRTHLENIYARLNVSSRAAAVTRAFPPGPP